MPSTNEENRFIGGLIIAGERQSTDAPALTIKELLY